MVCTATEFRQYLKANKNISNLNLFYGNISSRKVVFWLQSKQIMIIMSLLYHWIIKRFLSRCVKQGRLSMKKTVAGLWVQKFNHDVLIISYRWKENPRKKAFFLRKCIPKHRSDFWNQWNPSTNKNFSRVDKYLLLFV